MTLQDMLEANYRMDDFRLYYYDPYNEMILHGTQQVIIGKRTGRAVLDGMSHETLDLARHNRAKHRAGILTEDEAVIPCFIREDGFHDAVKEQHKTFSYDPVTREIETDYMNYYGWDNESTRRYMSIRELVSLQAAEEKKDLHEREPFKYWPHIGAVLAGGAMSYGFIELLGGVWNGLGIGYLDKAYANATTLGMTLSLIMFLDRIALPISRKIYEKIKDCA